MVALFNLLLLALPALARPRRLPLCAEPTVSAVPETPETVPETGVPPATPEPADPVAEDPSLQVPAPVQGGMWIPTLDTTWQIILSGVLQFNADGTLTPDVDAYDVDMFLTPESTIAKLHEKGKKVICYFSAGSYEDVRPDAAQFRAADRGSKMDGWPEYWVDVSSSNIRSIMAQRIAMAKQKGCDAIDPDNVDAFDNRNGLGITRAQSEDFVKFLAQTAADLGMSTGLKNAADLVPSMLGSVHFAVNEQCAEYDECDVFAAFTKAGKPVFGIEYTESGLSRKEMCEAATKYQFSTVIKNLDLDGSVEYCDGSKFRTPTAYSRLE